MAVMVLEYNHSAIIVVKMELSILPDDIQLEILSKNVGVAYILSKTCKKYYTFFRSHTLWNRICLYAYDTQFPILKSDTIICTTIMDKLRLWSIQTNACILGDLRLPPKQHRNTIACLMGYSIVNAINSKSSMTVEDCHRLIMDTNGDVQIPMCYCMVLICIGGYIAYAK